MVIKGGSDALEAGEKPTGSVNPWIRFLGLLEMAGRGASMAPFIGEREMRIVVRDE